MIADAQRESGIHSAVLGTVLRSGFRNTLGVFTQRKHRQQAPFHCFLDGDGLVFQNGPDKIISVEISSDAIAAQEQ